MGQLKLFDCEVLQEPVNVASVPMRSPFRYPGGKTWFIPFARRWLRSLEGQVELVEPFAGGGIVSLTACFDGLVKKAVMVEKDEDIAAVWKTILGDDRDWLIQQIISVEIELKNVHCLLQRRPHSTRERAFLTILRNRLNHGGILADGAGLIKQGESGKGLKSRWYPGTLKKRIADIAIIADRVEFIEGDGFEVMELNSARKDVVFFIDPPYTKAGRRLYKYHQIDHEHLFDIVKQIKGDFIVTYDDVPEIESMALQRNLDIEKVIMKTTHHLRKYELVIGRDLRWLREMLAI